ncbi:MAG: S16 family serine protease [Candidatus Methanoperedens sp.]
MAGTNKLLKIITLLLSVLLIGSAFQLYTSLEKINLQNQTITGLVTETNAQKETISGLEISVNNLKQNLSTTETQLKNETQRRQQLEDEIINLTMVSRADYDVLAVDNNDVGHLIPLEVILRNGTGELLLNVANVLLDQTLQSSAQTAVHVARDVARKNLADKDIIINIKSPLQEQLLISGGSGGSAMTLAATAAMQGKTMRKDVLITGTINDDHSIGQIGSPRAKGLAARDAGVVLFLVPLGQKADVGDIGIEVREVGTIEDAMKYAMVQ